LLTGLPVLSAVQFLGGVEPLFVFAGFAATALTIGSLAGISILASVLCKRSREAILMTYLTIVVYCVLCGMGSALVSLRYFPDPLFPDGPTVDDIVSTFQAGNPSHALYETFSKNTGSPVQQVPGVLLRYAVFHSLITLVTVSLAVIRLRLIALRETTVARIGSKQRAFQRSVGEQPMVWKEMHFGGIGQRRRWSLLLFGLIVLLSFAPLAPMMYEARDSYIRSPTVHAFNTYVRIVGTMVACLCLLGVAVRGSVAVRSERDKDTLDALLTSPLSSQEILFGKWVGCLWGMRWPGVWLASIYAIGLITGGLSPIAIPLLCGVVLVYAGTLATVGLWFSVVCRTTVRATVATVFTTLGLSVGHWLLWLCCLPFGGGGGNLESVIELQASITPPVVLCGFLSFSVDEHDLLATDRHGEILVYSLLGTIAWAILGGILWAIMNERFQLDTNRSPSLRPDKTWPPKPTHPAGENSSPSATPAP
jgi:ABC-type transport system involved in multi-copper enzyme maturation permease subunit